MLLYAGLTPIDLIAPYTVLAPFMRVHLVWKDVEPIVSDHGLVLHPTTAFADCPRDLDVLFVPGGSKG